MTLKTSTKRFPEMEFIELNSFSLGSFSRNVALNQLGVGRDGQLPLCKGFLCFQEAAAEDVLLSSRSLSTGEAAAPGQPEALCWLPPGRERWPGGQSTGKDLNCRCFLVMGEFLLFSVALSPHQLGSDVSAPCLCPQLCVSHVLCSSLQRAKYALFK